MILLDRINLSWPALAALGAVLILSALVIRAVQRKAMQSKRVRFGSLIDIKPQSNDPAIGAVLGGRYILGRPLQKRHQANLYEARDLSDQPRVLRRIPEAFYNSAKTAASLKHQNIQGVEAIFQDGAGVYMVYDSVPEQSVSLLLDKFPGRRMTAGQALGVLRPVCEALDYAHANSCFHGHLSPFQILMDGKNQVKVKDFCIPSQNGEKDYQAPEQETGGSSPEADIFALGACLYEILTGHPPIGRGSGWGRGGNSGGGG